MTTVVVLGCDADTMARPRVGPSLPLGAGAGEAAAYFDDDGGGGGVSAELVERVLAEKDAVDRFEGANAKYRPARTHPSFAVIPRLVPRDDEPLTPEQHKIRDMSRDVHFNRKASKAVPGSDLDELRVALEAAAGAGSDTIGYDELAKVRHDVARKKTQMAQLLHPHVLLRLHRNEQGRVTVSQVVDIIEQEVSVEQVRLDLCMFDTAGRGELSEDDLNQYIEERVAADPPVLPQLATLDPEFYATYTVYASRKFFFFLDRHRARRIKIKDMLISDVLREFNELMQEERLPPEIENSNWFSVPFVSKVHREWMDLDADKNGLLSKQELRNFNGGCLTDTFVERLFQHCPTYDGEVDYKVYLDLVLAKTYPRRPESIRFMASLLDLGDRGHVTRHDVAHFWSGVMSHTLLGQYDPPGAANIVNEVFDMVNPRSPDRITVNELVKCGVGHTVCSILTDVEAFFAYDNRESTGDGGQL